MDRAIIKKNKNLFYYLWSSLAPFLRVCLGIVEGISIITGAVLAGRQIQEAGAVPPHILWAVVAKW